MTIEQIELRKILTQMLADNGINRETITGFVKEIVDEKIEQTIKHILANGVGNGEGTFEDRVDDFVDKEVKRYIDRELTAAARAAVRDKINGYFTNVSVTVNLRDPEDKLRKGVTTSI